MANKKFKYEGNRQGMYGIEKSFDSNSLDEVKLKRLQKKGWVEVKPKPKKSEKKDSNKK